MKKSILTWQKPVCLFLLLCCLQISRGQTPPTLNLTDFAIWGGSASSNPYNSSLGVFINNSANIQGNIGSSHLIDIKNDFKINGNVYTGNILSINNNAKFTGNIFANRAGTTLSPVISAKNNDTIIGNLTANGKIAISTGKVTGQVAVPTSKTNYTGPVPSGGVVTTINLPVMPVFPANSPFDNQVAANISSNIITNPTTALSPGVYRKLALAGNKTLTFNGPGNYVFYEVDNSSSTNKFVFDFKNTAAGSINIFVIKDARWGTLTVSTINGNFPSRIYTEIHGDGSTMGGYAFSIQSPSTVPAGSNIWLGNVWAPNGPITITNTNILTGSAVHVIGALWSGKKVTIQDNFRLTYQAPAAGPDFQSISPLYPAPVNGKVAAANNIIGAELLALSQDASRTIQSNDIFVIQNDRDNTRNVLIEVVSKTASDNVLKANLISLGMTNEKGAPGVIDNGPDIYSICGYFPIEKITQLNSNSRINFVRPLYPAISNIGAVTTQGDATMRSNFVRSRFGVDGSGIKIGVISDSYNAKAGAQDDVNEGDLPGITTTDKPNDNPEPVQVLQDLLDGRGNDEGRAMLQIVHDVAPGAKLAFCTGFLSPGSFANAIGRLSSDTLPGGRCDVIVDDITYITAPFLNDGSVARAVDTAVKHGVTYFSSAGNFGSQSYEAVFNGVTDTSVIKPGQIHNFASSGTDLYQSVNLKPGSYTIVLQWSDPFFTSGTTGVQTDLDLYIVGANGFKLFGFNRSNLFGDPFEVCPFTVTQETNAKIMVVRAAGNTNVRFKYIIFRGDATLLNYPTGTSTLVGHPNADSTIAVGAMLYANIPPFTPVWPGVASFSSRGGTFTQASGNTFTQRNKPELIAPNGVNTTVNLGGPQFNDGDTYPNFFGTSAAAPHAAAVGALLIQARRKYLKTAAGPAINVRPYQIRQQLVSSAGKFSYLPGNFSYEGGFGFVQADSAIQQMANARPVISKLEAVVPGAQNSAQPFAVKITGKYLTSNTVIYLNNSPVNPTTVSIDPTTGVGTATATIPAIPSGQDPPFQLYNPPKSPSNLDGGYSETLHFFSSTIIVKVKADNKSRKYGQENPQLTASVSIINGTDSLDISQTGFSLAELKLDNLILSTYATASSKPRSYGISVARTTPLPDNDSLASKYMFEFDPGTLTVERMPLKITPDFKTLKYGDDLSGVTYSYQFDTAGILSPQLQEEVKSLYKQYLAENGLIVVNGFNSQTPSLSATDLTNVSAMTSFQSLRNARKFIVQNGQLTALNGNISASQIGTQRFIVDVSGQSLQNYKSNPAQSSMVAALAGAHARTLLNIKSLTSGNAKASVPGGQLQPMVNGQLLATVNGQIQALVNGQLWARINDPLVAPAPGFPYPEPYTRDTLIDVNDMTFQNGQLLALRNGVWVSVPRGEIILPVVSGQPDSVKVKLSVVGGQLQAVANGQAMTAANGQLQATINGQSVAVVNGQFNATVDGQLAPLLNGQLMAIVNGQLQPAVNGQLIAIVNGQLMVEEDNGDLETVEDLLFSNGELEALVSGQLKALVNGQLKALVNGVVTDVPITSFSEVNGQLRAIVNGQTVAYLNGQLKALVNGQLKALVNGTDVVADSVIQLANGQLKALVNGVRIPIANGQLHALVNGQLLSMVNGQLMAFVNSQLTFVVFQNGQLKALVNGQLQTLLNGQLKAIVNGDLAAVNSYSILNGQLRAIVNGETWVYPNGQLKALVNGQLQTLVNNFDVSGTNNNSNTLVLVDEDDINQQSGDVGGMLSMNMITGLDAGYQTLIPGAFVNENFEVTYGLGTVLITKKPLNVTVDHKTKTAGSPNPPLTVNYNGFAFGETSSSLCLPVVIPPSPKSIDQLERRTTYSDVKINGQSNVYTALPGEVLTLAANYNETHLQNIIPGYVTYCPGCITQNYIGMNNGDFSGNQFDTCYDVSGTGSFSGTINKTFTAPTRPGVYYITQQSSFYFYCYQFGHLLNDQIANDAIAVVFVNPSSSVTANTSATDTSSEGSYPIIAGGCYFNSNYRIVFKDDSLTVSTTGSLMLVSKVQSESTSETVKKETKLYPNPASNNITLQFGTDLETTTDIQVYDVLGRLAGTFPRKISEGSYELNVSNLASGVYLIKATTNKGIKTFKFIKL